MHYQEKIRLKRIIELKKLNNDVKEREREVKQESERVDTTYKSINYYCIID